MGVILKILMVRLNLHKFFVQGGDWGAIMAPHISILFPKNVIGMHSNMCASIKPISLFKRLFYSVFPPLIVEKKYEHSVYPLSDYLAGFMEEMGYFHLQTTKPDTIGELLQMELVLKVLYHYFSCGYVIKISKQLSQWLLIQLSVKKINLSQYRNFK